MAIRRIKPYGVDVGSATDLASPDPPLRTTPPVVASKPVSAPSGLDLTLPADAAAALSTLEPSSPLDDANFPPFRTEIFADEYIVDCNASRAAKAAGYSPGYAGTLMRDPYVRDLIKERYKKINGPVDVRARRVLNELSKIAHQDIRDLFDDDGRLINIKQLPDYIAAAISSVEVTNEQTITRDEVTTHSYVTRVKLWDKLKAQGMLGKHFGILQESIKLDVNVTHEPIPLDKLPIWLRAILVLVLEGGTISEVLQNQIMSELANNVTPT